MGINYPGSESEEGAAVNPPGAVTRALSSFDPVEHASQGGGLGRLPRAPCSVLFTQFLTSLPLQLRLGDWWPRVQRAQ